MFIKKRGKAKAKAAAEGAALKGEDGAVGAPGGGGGGGGAFITNDDDFDHRLGNYQLMEPIGKGGYGTVYRGLNIERGMTVAVKRVNLQGIPHDELEGIEMEIRLLQNLSHPNIVKYLDSMRSDEFLNIILEYVENGSLSSLLVKFGGRFPEQLCAHYITQVLKGLHYLHTQGVIHRDIKGANILSTKEGQVKLADFGVATKLNESRKSDSVVGTPYWMAPEIIEMTGQQSSACDIWSVGCTALELLTGKPPYFDLQQMPALFRIVQDEHPPLPDGISPALEDFLMQCFCEDTQLLAFDGANFRWMGVDDLLKVQAATSASAGPAPLQLASYNDVARAFEYHALTAPLLLRQGQHRMVDLRQDESDLQLSVTHDHTMYVRAGRHGPSGTKWEQPRTKKLFEKRPASTMLGSSTADRVKLLAAAEAGAMPVDSSAKLPCTAPLGLDTPAMRDAFLQLYGYWLAAGRLADDALVFQATKPRQAKYLRELMSVAGLVADLDYTSREEPSLEVEQQTKRHVLSVHKAEWVSLFETEYRPATFSGEGTILLEKEATATQEPTKAFWWWVLRRLEAPQLRQMLNGMQTACGSTTANQGHVLRTSSVAVRDDLLVACLHAGYSATFRAEEAGTWSVTYADNESVAEPTLNSKRDVSERAYTGRVWCVTLPPHHLVLARKVLSVDAQTKQVLSASRPIITGQCFQKDPNRRIDAAGLLKHPWLRKSVEMEEAKLMEQEKGSASARPAKGKQSHESESDWDEESDERKVAARGSKGKKNSVATKQAGSDNEDDWDAAAAGEDDIDIDDLASIPVPTRRKSHKANAPSTASFPQDIKRKPARAPKKPDDEPEELVIKLRAPVEDDDDAFADFSDEDEPAEEDEPEDEDAEEVVEKTTMRTIRPTPQITPAALQKVAPGGTNASLTSTNSSLTSSAGGPGSASSTLSSSFLLSSSASAGVSGPKQLESFVENDEDELGEYAELDDEVEFKAPAQQQPQHKGLALPASHAHEADIDDLDELEDEADPFDDITFEDGDNAAEDVLLNRAFLRVLDLLSPQNEERVILDACASLHAMGQKNPEQVRVLMTNHGVIPIMEMLEVTNPLVLHAVLKVVNQLVGRNIKFQQNMSLVGLIPAIIRFGGPSYPTEIRMESASFVRQFCYATDWTRKMFIACDGLPVLVSFLLEDYRHSKTLQWNAIDCIRHVFDINTSPKNDFCRLFCKFGLLEPLSKTLIAIQSDTESADAPDYVLKIAKILHLFSQGDKVVKLHFAKPAVIESMLKVLPALPQDILILLLKSIRNISMDSTTLDLLESAGAIPALVPFLDASQVSENQHQVLLTMYYLCQIKSSRQEQAALSGIIPHLQRFIRQDHPLKQFAYPIIFLLAKTSWRSRLELKKHGGLQFYIDILVSADLYWRSYALEIIAFWLASSGEDAARVSFVLNTSSNINKLLRVFRETTDEAQFDKLGNSMKKLLSASTSVNQSMGRQKEFIKEIKARLDRHAASNNIRLTLLRILALMVSTHANPTQLIADADGLGELIHKLFEEKSAVIVSDMAQKILQKLKVPAPAQTA